MPYQILLVDDDREFREEFRDAFSDYEIVEAVDGDSALDVLLRPNTIDLIILDVRLPGQSGTELLSKMKELAPGVGIIMATGYSSEEVAIASLKGHADEYLQKPLDFNKLRAIIERLLEKHDQEPALESCDVAGKVERVKHFAERNLHKKITLEDAAASVGLSPKYLSRIFKQETGKGFSEYRTQVRMRQAIELLEQTGYNVNQISEKLAYENAESFIRAFKKEEGCTPAEYRRKRKGTA